MLYLLHLFYRPDPGVLLTVLRRGPQKQPHSVLQANDPITSLLMLAFLFRYLPMLLMAMHFPTMFLLLIAFIALPRRHLICVLKVPPLMYFKGMICFSTV